MCALLMAVLSAVDLSVVAASDNVECTKECREELCPSAIPCNSAEVIEAGEVTECASRRFKCATACEVAYSESK